MKNPIVGVVLLVCLPIHAELTKVQKVADFRNLADVIAKKYAPYEWKKQALGTDALDIGSWLARVEETPNDVEFWQVCAEYVAALQDGHTYLYLPATFEATLGFTVDIFEGNTLIDTIDRALMPAEQFPFKIGDELVAIDGRPVEELLLELGKTIGEGNPRTARRWAADSLTWRNQSVQPRASRVPDESTITVRAESGETADYLVKWKKEGTPVTSIPYSPPVRGATAYDLDTILNRLAPRKYKNFLLPAKGLVVGLGAKQPVFGLPEEGFTKRLGGASTDQVVSGVFERDGLRIGYLRLPHFVSTRVAQQAITELTYFRGKTGERANTDGLVVDLMRNLGGSPCLVEDVLARMIPEGFLVPTAEYRVSWSDLLELRDVLEFLKSSNAPSEEIAEVELLLFSFQEAAKNGTPRTEKLPLCGTEYQRGPAYDSETGEPASYAKPIVVLVDEFTASAGEIMAAVLQDSNRARIIGMRTAGAGGSVSYSLAGVYSEAEMSLAVSLAHRSKDIVTHDLPTAPLLENIGVLPDVELDYMTRANLLNKGEPFLGRVLELAAAGLREK